MKPVAPTLQGCPSDENRDAVWMVRLRSIMVDTVARVRPIASATTMRSYAGEGNAYREKPGVWENGGRI